MSFERPKLLEGRTIKLRLPQGSIYVTVNDLSDASEPREVFITIGKAGEGEKAVAEALGRVISLYLQKGGAVADVISTMKGIGGGQPGWDDGLKLQSVPDAVAKALELLTSKAQPARQ